MNGALGGETKFFELEDHEESLNAHPNSSKQDTYENNESIREEGDNNKGVVNEENGGIIPESTTVTPLTNEPSQNVLFDHIPQVPLSYSSNELETMSNDSHTPTSRYPIRKTKGISRIQYEPYLNVNSKYHIRNYTSTKILLTSYALTINQLSKVSIPSVVQEALTKLQWRKAMNEEIEALQKN